MRRILGKSLYVSLGAVDAVAASLARLPALTRIRDISLLEQARDLEPRVRRRAVAAGRAGSRVTAAVSGVIGGGRTESEPPSRIEAAG
ncbi:MAG TPA: hypothetical protein VNE62_05025 [Actinomycetota bacterium]|nr:hypothetical protein [Actinomycetota bacterium]